jgi:hypothetical protein
LRNIEARFEDFPAALRSGCNESKPPAAAKGGLERAMLTKTTRITIETESLLVVRRAKTVVAWCPACSADVEVMTVEGDDFSEAIPAAHLRDWLATGKLHLWRFGGGPAQICFPSLLQCFEAEAVPRLGNPKTDSKAGDEQ